MPPRTRNGKKRKVACQLSLSAGLMLTYVLEGITAPNGARYICLANKGLGRTGTGRILEPARSPAIQLNSYTHAADGGA